MTSVYYLFLLHASLGLLAALLLVPEKAGAAFFKLCSGAAAFMTLSGLWLAVRRFGWDGGPGLAASAALLALAVGYNRAVHFDWRAARTPLLAGAVASGLAASLLAGGSPLALVSGLSSALLLGAAASAMILGHYYLVVLDLPISALRRLTILLVVALALRCAVVGFAMLGPVHAGLEAARLVAHGSFDPDGVFVWMRLLFGLAGPLSLLWLVWKTVEIRSTQSATGILYVQLFLVLSGELLATYLRVAAGFPL